MKWYVRTALVLANIGAINWGLDALNWNAVESLLGWAGPTAITVAYVVVALCGVWGLIKVFQK